MNELLEQIKNIHSIQNDEINLLKQEILKLKKEEEYGTNLILKQDTIICNLRDDITRNQMKFQDEIIIIENKFKKEKDTLENDYKKTIEKLKNKNKNLTDKIKLLQSFDQNNLSSISKIKKNKKTNNLEQIVNQS